MSVAGRMSEGREAILFDEDGNEGVRVEKVVCKESSSRALFVGLLMGE